MRHHTATRGGERSACGNGVTQGGCRGPLGHDAARGAAEGRPEEPARAAARAIAPGREGEAREGRRGSPALCCGSLTAA
eukprot:6588545-Prymnesium_polylepis.1